MHNHNDLHKNNIRRCFNRAALTYDQYSYPQQLIGCKLIEYVYHSLPQVTSIIDLGCGTGIITEKLILKLNPQMIYGIDLADELLRLAEKRLLPFNPQLFNMDFDQLSLNHQPFQLVFSNMALHWSINLPKTLKIINRHLSENGLLAFSLPTAGTFFELHWKHKNKFSQLEAITQHLAEAGFERASVLEESFVFKFNSWLRAIKSIKATGANYLFNPEEKLLKNKKVTFNHQSGDLSSEASLTYNIGYFIARKTQHVA